jgi:hypothetical protein
MGKNVITTWFLSELYTSINKYRSFFICLQCYKQPPSSVLCGYDVCEVLKNYGRYQTNPEDIIIFIYCVYVQMPTIKGSWVQLRDKQIDNICADLTRFILHEICYEDGEFFDNEGVLSLDDAEMLRRWVS